MKKRLLLVVLIAIIGLPLGARDRDREEMIVLFDTSVSVLPIYDELSALVLHGITSNEIQPGDTFHLLSFADEPLYEFSQDVRSDEDIQKISRYTEVLKPMGLHTDLILALNFLYSFTTDLPINTKKTILILTDGIHDPPPGSSTYGRDQEWIENEIASITGKIQREGWTVRILETSNRTLAESTQNDETISSNEDAVSLDDKAADLESDEKDSDNLLNQLSEELKAPVTSFDETDPETLANRVMGTAHLTWPASLGDVKTNFTLPLEITNYSNLPINVNLTGVLLDGVDYISENVQQKINQDDTKTLKVDIELDNMPIGKKSLAIEFVFAEGINISPLMGFIEVNITEVSKDSINPIILIVIAGIIALMIIIIVVTRIRSHIDDQSEESKDSNFSVAHNEQEQSTSDKSDITSPISTHSNKASTDKKSKTQTSISDHLAENDPKNATSQDKHSKSTVESQEINKKQNSVSKKKSGKENVTVHKDSSHPRIRPEDSIYAVEMKVEGQNPNYGTRNIRVVKEGSPVSIGSKGQLQIFISPISSQIGQIEFDGKSHNLNIIDEKVFGGKKETIKNCLDNWITLIDENGQPLNIRFSKWISPLERINRLMHSIDKPGEPESFY